MFADEFCGGLPLQPGGRTSASTVSAETKGDQSFRI